MLFKVLLMKLGCVVVVSRGLIVVTNGVPVDELLVLSANALAKLTINTAKVNFIFIFLARFVFLDFLFDLKKNLKLVY